MVDHCALYCRFGSVPATKASFSERVPWPPSRPL